MDKGIDSAVKVKWYSTIFLLVGTVLAVADPVTDILTLREFYINDHKTWFGVGLVFVILPSLVISCLYYFRSSLAEQVTNNNPQTPTDLVTDIVFGWNPLALAVMRFKAFILCFRNFNKLWQGKLEDECNEKIEGIMKQETLCGIFEAILESAPQFIIQLHATIAQQEQVSAIQTVSLCVSFISLAWTSASADVWRFLTASGSSAPSKFKAKVVFFISQLFHLSSRLFAITFFTAGFAWWIIAVLVLHNIIMAFVRVWVDITTPRPGGCCDCDCSCCENCCLMPVACLVYWMRDDGAFGITASEFEESLIKIMLASNILFMIENVIMICVFYAKEEPHAWYSVPVTICVCVFSLVGFLVRMALCRRLLYWKAMTSIF